MSSSLPARTSAPMRAAKGVLGATGKPARRRAAAPAPEAISTVTIPRDIAGEQAESGSNVLALPGAARPSAASEPPAESGKPATPHVLEILSHRRAQQESAPDVPAGKAGAAPVSMRARRHKRDWEPVATFVVEFQSRAGKGKTREQRTYAHHHEASLDMDWAGFVPAVLCRWMMARLDSQAPADEDPQALDGSVAPPPHEPAAARVAPVPQVPQAPSATDAGPSSNRGPHLDLRVITSSRGQRGVWQTRPLRVAAGQDFVVEVMATSLPERSTSLVVHLHARSSDEGHIVALGRAKATTEHAGQPLRLRLPAAALPGGSYRLSCVPVVDGVALPSDALSVPLDSVVA